jgi:Asp/Glu/hydantoin racemase
MATGPRIFLVHAYGPSIAPIGEAFRAGWPEAEVLNLLDESLYRDVAMQGVSSPSLRARLTVLLRYCVDSGGRGIVFTGSTFGPIVDQARVGIPVPVLKADEAMAEAAVAKGRRILVVCTANRSLPVIRGNVQTAAFAAKVECEIGELWVPGAMDANDAGRTAEHDRLVADAVTKAAPGWDVIVLGQISMAPSLSLLQPDVAARTLTSPTASVAKMRALLGSR